MRPFFRNTNPVLVALLTASLVVTVALFWFGVRNLAQQTAVERQHEQERLDNGADAIAAGIKGKLAEAGERLSRWISNVGSPAPGLEGAVVVAASEGRTQVVPRGGIPFVPEEMPAPALDNVFAGAEAIEFGSERPAQAAETYRKLSRQGNPRVRAEALLRLGRVSRTTGDLQAAMAAYATLAQLEDIAVEGLPAELAGLDGQRLTRAAAGDQAGEQRIAAQIARSIDEGRWLLPRARAEVYREMSARDPKPESWILAEALARSWETEVKGHGSAAGLHVIEIESRPVLAIWRSNGSRSAALASFAEGFIGRNAAAGFAFQLTDAAGHRIAGASAIPSQTAVRVIDPWVMRIWSDGAAPGDGSRSSQQFLLTMLSAVILFLWGTVYFMARAIGREARVARLQSDFVAAVSHEFRSPLTTVRQLSEMLEMDQIPNEERRRKYYHVLASEVLRLQRLVETLLNFGKMEAGAEQYHFQKLDVRELVCRAVREASGENDAGRTRVGGAEDRRIQVWGDADALTLALRNLVDNGLKYSPANEDVQVTWDHRDGRVSISVIDHGPGIPEEEHQAVFRKFVRGRAAMEAGIKGTGVGLAMVKHILTAHSGRIRLESQPGQGATFTIELAEVR